MFIMDATQWASSTKHIENADGFNSLCQALKYQDTAMSLCPIVLSLDPQNSLCLWGIDINTIPNYYVPVE
jgi:hypothetical protein